MTGWRRRWWLALPALALYGCSQTPTTLPVTLTATFVPVDGPRGTPPSSQATSTIELLPTLGPSPTPLSYTVKPNDTLNAIAYRFGVSLDALLAANPGINPSILSIGQTILVPPPTGDQTATPIPTPTPLPIDLSPALCFRTSSDALWCLVTVHNTSGMTVEGVRALITLVDASGNPLLTVAADAPINLVPADEEMVLAAFVPSPAPAFQRAAASLTMAFPVQEEGKRYLSLDLTTGQGRPSPDGLSWAVDVGAALRADAVASGRASVVLMAFDTSGAVVGYTKKDLGAPLKPGETRQATLVVYSLGPKIDRISVAAEAAPAP